MPSGPSGFFSACLPKWCFLNLASEWADESFSVWLSNFRKSLRSSCANRRPSEVPWKFSLSFSHHTATHTPVELVEAKLFINHLSHEPEIIAYFWWRPQLWSVWPLNCFSFCDFAVFLWMYLCLHNVWFALESHFPLGGTYGLHRIKWVPETQLHLFSETFPTLK